MTELADALTARYTSRLQALRDQVRGAVGSLYRDTVTPDDLNAAFAELTTRVAPLVRAGQAHGVALSGAYLQVLVALEANRPADFSPFSKGIVGTTAQGLPLEKGMAAWPSMVKQQIGQGVPLEQAMDFGSYLAERFADAEVTSAVDRHTEAVTQQSGQFSGWIGVIAGTCDLCREQNSGTHALGEPVYRHPNCKCTKQFVVEGVKPSMFPELTAAEKAQQVWFVSDIAMYDNKGNLIPAGQLHTDSIEFNGWGLKRGAVAREAQMRSLLASDGILGKPAEMFAIEGDFGKARSTWIESWQDGSDNPMSAMAARHLSEQKGVPGAIWSKGQPLMEPSGAMRDLTDHIYNVTRASLKEESYTLYRGVGTRDGSGNVLESWTTDPEIARRFDGFAVYEAQVPADQIFLDLSTSSEAEMVVMGASDLPMRVFEKGAAFGG
jgi:hypothetical protein